MTRPGTAPIDVLLVEDDPHDVELMRHALRTAKVRNQMRVAHDGVEALDFLQRQAPDLILLDLHLPKSGGWEVLERIKSDERLRNIPVVIVTGSEAEEDVAQSYRVRANAYLRKPVEPAAFLKAVNAIGAFWLEIVKVP